MGDDGVREAVARLNRARRGTKAKLVVGGHGVWEHSIVPEEIDRLGIDLAFQGEADDISNELVEEIVRGETDSGGRYFGGFQSLDATFHKWVSHDKFMSRRIGTNTSKQDPRPPLPPAQVSRLPG